MEKKQIDWENLGFGYVQTEQRYVSNYKDGKWDEGGLTEDAGVVLNECAGVLQYAQTVFEGMKAYTTEDGKIVVFRPDLNAARMADSARRLEMPVFPEERFLEAVKEVVKANIDRVKQITDKPFGVNIMLLSPFADDIVDLVIEEGVKVVTTGAGNPGKYMERFHEAGIIVIPVIPSVALAKRMEKLGADAVVAEGMEAGGHIGKLTTMALVRQVADAVSIPVIGAGGVADGRGMAAVLMLGADAVQVGTRFAVAKESNAHQNFKDKILKAKDIDTVISASVVGHPVRAIKNKLATEYNQAEKDFLAGKKTQEEIEELGAGALRNAVVDGDVEYGSVMAGQIAGLVRKEETCAEILEDLYTGAAKVIKEEAARWADVNV